MNLVKAKELAHDAQRSLRLNKFPDHADAIAILIECATWFILSRVNSPGIVPDLLHGETKE